MLILSTSSSSQSFSVIPRHEPSGDVTVTFVSSQQNKQTHSFTYAATYANGYLTIVNTFDPVLVENNSYLMTVKDGSDVIYRSLVYVTDQTDEPKFSINEGVYTEPSQSSNEFVII